MGWKGWRVRRVRGVVCLVGLAISLCTFAAYVMSVRDATAGPSATAGLVRLPKRIVQDTWMSVEQVKEMSSQNKCPVCFGRDACPELEQGLRQSSIGVSRQAQLEGSVFSVYSRHKDQIKYWLKPLQANEVTMASFEEWVCRNASKRMSAARDGRNASHKCEVSVAAKSSFLYTSTLEPKQLWQLFRAHLVSRRRIPLTNCPTFKLIRALVEAFDQDEDLTLTAEEKAMLLTTVATQPHVAIHRIIQNQRLQFPVLPFFGACGTMILIQAPHYPLNHYLDHPLAVRLNLAEQILQLIDSFLHDDPNWVLFMTDLSFDNVVVTLDENRLFLKDLSQGLLLDRDLMDSIWDNQTTSTDLCDARCVGAFLDGVSSARQTSPEINWMDQMLQDCSTLVHHGNFMFQLACQNILADLLHSLDDDLLQDQSFLSSSHEVQTLIKTCANHTHWSSVSQPAALQLIEILGGSRQNQAQDQDFQDT